MVHFAATGAADRTRAQGIMDSVDMQHNPILHVTGYSHQFYAESLSELGDSVELPYAGGWILRRQTPVLNFLDAMGCYPIFCCQQWQKLGDDLAQLQKNLVSLSLVADPFGNYTPDFLKSLFDVTVPYKQHFIADLSVPLERYTSARHRKYARRALDKISVEVCDRPAIYLDEWVSLYDHLVARKHITGIHRFSRKSFAEQLSVPGLVMFRATEADEPLCLDLWYVQGDVAYAHLVGTSPRGYELQVSYGLKLFILQYFASRVRWADLGAVPGMKADANSGLAGFKRGWSSETRTAFFCGKIFNLSDYRELVRVTGSDETPYFPAYRKGEFS
jgi:hypothetical protein